MSRLVTIAKFADQSEAFVVRSLLEDAGIECFLHGEHQIAAQPFLLHSKQGLQIQVFSEDEDRATKVLRRAIEEQDQ